jgi:hypothetical protein
MLLTTCQQTVRTHPDIGLIEQPCSNFTCNLEISLFGLTFYFW